MNNYPINHYYQNIIYGVVNTAIQECKRVTLFRFDLRYPLDALYMQHEDGNITKFINSLKAKITADVKLKQKKWNRKLICPVNYVWVRECGEVNSNLHFHLLLALPKDLYHCFGNFKSDKQRNLATLINEAWASALGLRHENFMKHAHFGSWYYLERLEAPLNPFIIDSSLASQINYMAKTHTKIKDLKNNIGHSFIRC